MKSYKHKIKIKDLKQIVIIFSIILFSLTGYIIAPKSTSQETLQTNISIEDIPEYSGQIVISINNNVPYFDESDITTQNFENYAKLDELGRARVAFANICEYTMPQDGDKRGSISYNPSGWNQYLYGENNKYHLYERCHLIAWQLGSENNNKNNLITGTSELNDAMIEYENEIAKWIKGNAELGKYYHVLYRVTPIYKGDNLLASGVHLEAKSVEEEGISFNIFIYNIHNDFVIDYTTGKATLIE